jgi:hypothetical protein
MLWDDSMLAGLLRARAVARDRSWARGDDVGRGFPVARAAGRELPGLVLDLDASLVATHSEKEAAAATFTGGFGCCAGWTTPPRRWPGDCGPGTPARQRAKKVTPLAQLDPDRAKPVVESEEVETFPAHVQVHDPGLSRGVLIAVGG